MRPRHIALLGLLAASPAWAQQPDPEWLRASREAGQLNQSGNHAQALEKLQALPAACPPATPAARTDRAVCLSILASQTANALIALRRDTEAEQSLREALSIREQDVGQDHPLTGDAAAALGTFLVQRRRYEDGATHLERAVEILGKPLATGGRTAAQRANLLLTTYTQLAIAYRAQDRLPAAITVSRESLETMIRLTGPTSPPTTSARVNLANLLREQGQADAAIDALLAALQPESLPLDQRLRLATEAAQAGAALGRTDAVQPAVDTALSLMGQPDEAQRPIAIALLLAAAELALARSDPDTALALADQANELAGDNADRRAAAQVMQARALLGQSHPNRAAALLRAIPDPGFDVTIWTVRSLIEAGQMPQAEETLTAAKSALAARENPPLAQQALLLQFTAMLAERRAQLPAARAALERAVELLPKLETRPPNAAQLANITRDLIRLRTLLARDEATREAAIPALRTLHDTQAAIGMPPPARLDTKLTEAWIATELQRFDDARAASAAILEQLPALERQTPRAAAVLLSRLAEITLAIPGTDSASNALAQAERARLALERVGIAGTDLARANTLRGSILLRLDRAADAARACQAALDPAAPSAQLAALTCLARAEAAQGRHGESALAAQRLLDSTGPDRPREQAEAMRLLAAAQLGLGNATQAEAILRDALTRAENLAPTSPGRRPALRAEIWGDIVTVLLRQGAIRDARNAAAAGRQAASEDRAGGATMARALELEGETLLAQEALDEAASAYERAVSLRRGRFGGDALAQATALAGLARVEAARGRFAEAATLADTAIAALRALPSPPRRDLAAALNLRADLHEATGAFTTAETTRREAIALLATAGPAAGTDIAWARLSLARLLARRGAPTEAETERGTALATLSETPATPPSVLAAARLERVGQLLRDGKASEAAIPRADCALATGPDVATAVPDFAQPARCRIAEATALLAAGDATAAHRIAETLLASRKSQGDTSRPTLAAPLALLAATQAATGDLPSALATSTQAVALADRVTLADALALAFIRGTLLARFGEPAQAEGAFRAGLERLTDNLPRGFAPELIRLTEGAATALIAQGKPAEAVALWRASLARAQSWPQRNWPDAPFAHAALLRGQANALRAAGRPDSARPLFLEAAGLDATGAESSWLTDIQGAARAAMEAGRRAEAGALAARLGEKSSPVARLAHATTRALLAEEAGDTVTALLEYTRLASLAAEAPQADAAPTDPGSNMGTNPGTMADIAQALARPDHAAGTSLALLGAARAALALGQTAQARAHLAEARAKLSAPARPGSELSLALAEIDATLALAGTDIAAATTAIDAWHDLVAGHAGRASLPGLRLTIARATLESRQGEQAEAAALLTQALGTAERLRGRGSPLWSRVALLTAAAADRLGDTARATALRKEAEAAKARPDPGS